MTKGLEDYMLPCLNKQLFGIECLGCGIQRAAVLLFKGEFIAAFKMYPAIYSLFILVAFLLLNLFLKFKYAGPIKIFLISLNVAIIVISYIIKMNNYL
jgi:Protein of unknown function (DUF2752)